MTLHSNCCPFSVHSKVGEAIKAVKILLYTSRVCLPLCTSRLCCKLLPGRPHYIFTAATHVPALQIANASGSCCVFATTCRRLVQFLLGFSHANLRKHPDRLLCDSTGVLQHCLSAHKSSATSDVTACVNSGPMLQLLVCVPVPAPRHRYFRHKAVHWMSMNWRSSTATPCVHIIEGTFSICHSFSTLNVVLLSMHTPDASVPTTTVDGTGWLGAAPARPAAAGACRCKTAMHVTNGGFTTGRSRQALINASAVESSAASTSLDERRHRVTPESATDRSLFTIEHASTAPTGASAIACLHCAFL